MYLPARVWSQQNQDSVFRMGVLHILAGHSGPETAADARTHFGIFSPQVWKLFPRNQTIHLSFWDYNDVAPAYFAAAEIAAREQKVGIISLEVARPDFPVADRSKFADTDLLAAAKGFYVIRDFAPGPRHGYVVSQGSSSTVNLVSILPKLEAAGINVKVIAAISEEFIRSPAGVLSQFSAPARSPLRPDDRLHRHPPRVADQERWPPKRTSIRSLPIGTTNGSRVVSNPMSSPKPTWTPVLLRKQSSASPTIATNALVASATC